MAWVRKATQPPELMFATDSRLNTPGRWDVGIKVFELPRQGALIAFHGTASFAHTLIQHLEYDFLQRPEFQSTRQDLHDLAQPICEHFAQLFGEFRDSSTSFLNDVVEVEKAGTGFLLGGWSWRQQGHAIWRLNSDPPQRKFICVPVVAVGGNQFAFVGDDWQTAEQQIAEEATTRPLDMQPLRVLHARRKVAWIRLADEKRGFEGVLWYQDMSRVCPECPQTITRGVREGRSIREAYGGRRTSNIQQQTSNIQWKATSKPGTLTSNLERRNSDLGRESKKQKAESKNRGRGCRKPPKATSKPPQSVLIARG